MVIRLISANLCLPNSNRSGSKVESTKTLAAVQASLAGRVSHGDSGELGLEDNDDW